MSYKVAIALGALIFCFHTKIVSDDGQGGSEHAVVVNRPASTMPARRAQALDDTARTMTGVKGTAETSPVVSHARFRGGASAGRAKSWIKLTAPGGEQVHISVDQIASVRTDTEMSGANTQLDLASGKFQRVREDVDEVMQLISAASNCERTDDGPAASAFRVDTRPPALAQGGR